MSNAARFVLPAIVFLVTLVSGFWLSRSGKPLNTAIFTVHKLIALAAVVTGVIQIINAARGAGIPALNAALLVVVGLCAVALFVTGALMSANQPGYEALLKIHQVAPVLIVVAGAAVLYLVRG